MSTAKKIAILAGDYVEETELTKPLEAFRDSRHNIEVVSANNKNIQTINGETKGKTVKADFLLSDFQISNYDVLILPGGVLNAMKLRINENVRKWAAEFFDADKLLAVSGYSSLILVSADLIEEKQLTSPREIEDDIRNAGGEWTNRAVVTDKNLITGRSRQDMPRFIKSISEWLE